MALNDLGEEVHQRPITLPRFNLPPLDLETEIREAAQRVATNRLIRQGRDCWQQITKSNSVETWLAIGRALCIGKAWALRAANTDTAWGSAYSRCFGEWMAKHGFATMPKGTRTWSIVLCENAAAIEQWRSGLPEQERKRLRNPQSVVRKWRQSCIARGNGHRCPADLKRYALTAFRRFLVYVAALPATDQVEVWRVVEQTRGGRQCHDLVNG